MTEQTETERHCNSLYSVANRFDPPDSTLDQRSIKMCLDARGHMRDMQKELDAANARLANETFLCMEAQSPCRTYLRMKDDLDAANARIEELEAALRTTLRNTVHESDEQLLRIIEDAPHAEFCESTLTRGLPCNCFKSEAEALLAQATADSK